MATARIDPRPTAPAPPARWPSWVATSGLAVLIGIFLVAQIGAAGGLVVGFAVLTPIERIWKRHDQKIRRPGLRTDMFHLLLTGGATVVCLAIPLVFWFVVLTPVRDNSLAVAFNAQPSWLRAPEAFVLLELVGYWVHRLEHEVPLFWRVHQVHHSSQRLDWIAGARAHPLEGLIVGALAAPPLLVLGVGPGALGAFGVVTQLWGVVLHMNVRWRMRWLDGIWSSTDFHHWHHSNHREAHNTNYSAFLPGFDKLFGTYHLPRDRRPHVYGVDEAVPDGWFRQLAHPFRRSTSPSSAPATVVGPRLDKDEIMRQPVDVSG